MRKDLVSWGVLVVGIAGLLIWLFRAEAPPPPSRLAIQPELGMIAAGMPPQGWELLTAVCEDRRPRAQKPPVVVSADEDGIVFEGEEDPGKAEALRVAKTQYRRCLTLAQRWANLSMGRDPKTWRLPKEKCALEQARAKMWATAMQDHPPQDLVRVIAVHRARERTAFDEAVRQHSQCMASSN